MADANECAEHQTRVTPVWNVKENTYVLLCQMGEMPDNLTPNPTLTELWKQGQSLPPPVADNIKKRLSKQSVKIVGQAGATDITLLHTKDLETGEGLSPAQIQALIAYARQYNLDPARGHVVQMHGSPYIGIDGYLFHAHRLGVPFSLKSHPMSGEERKAYQVPEGDFAWISEVEKQDTDATVSGIGIVTAAELTEKAKHNPNNLRYPVIAKHPVLMCQKRAEWQALRRAFPIGCEA